MQSNLQKLHIAIIMDGNGRWAQKRNMPRFKGHCAGVSALQTIVKASSHLPISTLTLFAFSSDNWKRPKSEIANLMDLLRHYLKSEKETFLKNEIRFITIGRKDRLPKDIISLIKDVELQTQEASKLTLRVALDYSARYEILRAAQLVGASPLEKSALFSKALTGLEQNCDVDLLIRTSGEKRLSDFLLWESAYSELYFTDKDWPDFSEKDLKLAIEAFRSRDRRFGSVTLNCSTRPIATDTPAHTQLDKIGRVK